LGKDVPVPDLKCRGCGETALEPALDLKTTALADIYANSAEEAISQPRWPLLMTVCHKCWMAQLDDTVPDEELFGAKYGFFSGSSPALVEHFRLYADWAVRMFGPAARRGVVEIACNDGTLLAHFQGAGLPVLGFDPAAGPVAAAWARGLPVEKMPFGRKAAEQVDMRNVLVIANNVLAHVADPHDFLDGVRLLVGRSGAAVFEFQYLADLLAGNQFDLVYHQHRSYLSLTSAQNLLCQHGLAVTDVLRIPTQGGSLRIVVRPAPTSDVSPELVALFRAEAWLRRPEAYRGLQGRFQYVRDAVTSMVRREVSEGRRLAGYAATAKSTTLLTFCGLGRAHLDYVVDTTPAKIGKFTPGTGIEIISPKEADRRPVGGYLLLAGNYLPAVLRRERDFLAGGGRLIVPLPTPITL
jgi:hypothetical protein